MPSIAAFSAFAAAATAGSFIASPDAAQKPILQSCARLPDLPNEAINWDYIVVGSGPSGIAFATKMAEACKKVLMLEYGGPSLYRTGGRVQAPWMAGYELTPHDIWSLTGVVIGNRSNFCTEETTIYAPCILGGGAAINAGQHFQPPDRYWDSYWPKGWKANDVRQQVQNVARRTPASHYTQTDKVEYFTELYQPMKSLLNSMNFTEVDSVERPNEVSRHFCRDVFYTVNGQRGGPVVGYLMDALEMPNFRVQMHTKVTSVVRSGRFIKGVNALVDKTKEAYYHGKNVVLAAGAFGTPSILFNSGIGPKEQLEVSRDLGRNTYSSREWIQSPVGECVKDNPYFYLKLDHPSIKNYSTSEIYTNPQEPWLSMLLTNRTGPYTFLGRVLNVWFDVDVGVEPKINVQLICSPPASGTVFSCAVYIGEGIRSCADVVLNPEDGRTTIRGNPYISDEKGLDLLGYAKGLQEVLKALASHPVPQLELVEPVFEDINDLESIKSWISGRVSSNNHWQGSTRLGKSDGTRGGSDVVDLNCRVYGTDNLFVTDAGIATNMTTSNPVFMVTAFGEICASKVLGLRG